MTKTFNPALPVQTRCGLKAVIIATNVPADVPAKEGGVEGRLEGQSILAAVVSKDGEPSFRWFFPDGRYTVRSDDHRDLINDQPEVVEFANVGDFFGNLHAAQKHCPGWPVIKVVRKGDKVVSAEVVA